MFLILVYKIIIKLIIIYGVFFMIFEINKKGLEHYRCIIKNIDEEIDSDDLIEIIIIFTKKFNFLKKITFILWITLMIMFWPIMIVWYWITLLKNIFNILFKKDLILDLNNWSESLEIYTNSMTYCDVKNLLKNLKIYINITFECLFFYSIYSILNKNKEINVNKLAKRIAFINISGFSYLIISISYKLTEETDLLLMCLNGSNKSKKIKIIYILKIIFRAPISLIFRDVIEPLVSKNTKKIIKEKWRIRLNGKSELKNFKYIILQQRHQIIIRGRISTIPHNSIWFKHLGILVWFTKNGENLENLDTKRIKFGEILENEKIKNQYILSRKSQNEERVDEIGFTKNFIENHRLKNKEKYASLMIRAQLFAYIHHLELNGNKKYISEQMVKEFWEVINEKDPKKVENMCLESKIKLIFDRYKELEKDHFKMSENFNE